MGVRLLEGDIWPEITRAVQREPARCDVAVAYISRANLLPMIRGSRLVVDMSERAVRSGQTSPKELLKLIRKGVKVFSIENLHAKVFVVGDRAFVGSTNASQRSASDLVEAVLATTSARTVSACRRWVRELGSESVTPQYTSRMARLYRPPKGFGPGRRGRRRATPLHSDLWVVPLELEVCDEKERKEERRGIAVARRKLSSVDDFRLDDFHWHGAGLEGLRAGTLVVQLVSEAGKKEVVTPVARVIHVRRYIRGTRRNAWIFLEAPKQLRARAAVRFRRSLDRESARALTKVQNPRRVRNVEVAHTLLAALGR